MREDVNVILFDEPLTVIDPHLKWELRSKLKELHQRVGVTMIYVTHDQTEALTFADQVVVMHEGEVVQVGTPVDLFERPAHTFVGHFIGSPGMNVLPCELAGGAATLPRAAQVATANRAVGAGPSARSGCGRSSSRSAARDPGQIVRGRGPRPAPRGRGAAGGHADQRGAAARTRRWRRGRAHLVFDPRRRRHLRGRLAGGERRHEDREPAAWFFVLPVLVLVAFNALVPLMTVVNYSVQETFGNNVFFWHGVGWFEDVLRLASASTPRSAGSCSSPRSSC